MIELMLMMDSRGFRLDPGPSMANASSSDIQGDCGVTGDPVLE